MNKKKLIKLLIYVVSFLLAALLFYKAFVPLAPSLWEAIKSGDEAEIEAFLAQSGKLKGIIYLFLLQAIQVISIVLPGAPIEIAGGLAYGFWRSFITCHLSFVLTNLAIFCLGRKMKSDFIGDKESGKVRKFLQSGDPFVMLILCFMFPVVPNGIIPYAASAMRISAPKYFLSVFLGSSVQIFIMCAIGRQILSRNYLFIAVIIILDFIAMFILYTQREKINAFVSLHGGRVRQKLFRR